MLARCDVFVVYDDVQYTRRDWRNRNRIKTAQGTQWLTIPVLNKSKFDQQIREAKIDASQVWLPKHLNAIKLNYKKAPYFDAVYPMIEQSLSIRSESLLDVCLSTLTEIQKYLSIDCKVVLSSELCSESQERQERLIELCKMAGITWYYNGAAGKTLYQEKPFASEGITLAFQEYTHPTYRQLWGEFVSHLSIVDLLFNHGPESLSVLMGQSSLKQEAA